MADPAAGRTHHLDQLATKVRTQRDEAADSIAALIEIEQGMLRDLLATFPDIDQTLLGGLLLHLGGRMSGLRKRLPSSLEPQTAAIFVNLLQLAGERLWHGKPPVTWACPYLLVGGATCTAVLTAADEAELEPRIRGHLEMNHPETRRERRAAG